MKLFKCEVARYILAENAAEAIKKAQLSVQEHADVIVLSPGSAHVYRHKGRYYQASTPREVATAYPTITSLEVIL